jgi:hypothetical protein
LCKLHVAKVALIRLSIRVLRGQALIGGFARKHDAMAFILTAHSVDHMNQTVEAADRHSEFKVLVRSAGVDSDLAEAAHLFNASGSCQHEVLVHALCFCFKVATR